MRAAKAGIVVPSGDPEALAKAISELLRNRPLLEELGANGRRFVEQHYEWRRLVTHWLESLNSAKAGLPCFARDEKQNALEQQPERF